MTEEKKVVVIALPRKLFVTWLVTTILTWVLVLASFQYTNYVDRRSNRAWCGIVGLFNRTYQTAPPPSDAGKILAIEFARLTKEFECS